MTTENIIHRTESSLTVHAITTDRVSPDELREYRRQIETAIGELKGLSTFLEAAADERECRKTGNIQYAKRFERTVDACYANLPAWAKW